jgi:hypothetical protein
MAADHPLCAYCVRHLLHKSDVDLAADERDCPTCELLANASPDNNPTQDIHDHRTGRVKLETRVTCFGPNKVKIRASDSNRLRGTLVAISLPVAFSHEV